MDLLTLAVRLHAPAQPAKSQPAKAPLAKVPTGSSTVAPFAGFRQDAGRRATLAPSAPTTYDATGAMTPSTPTATPAATPAEPSDSVKRMMEQAAKGKEAMEAAKAKEKQVAQEERKKIRKRLDLIVKKLRILQNLYANDPKKMASQLSAVFKELKTAMKDYRNAGGTLTSMIGDTEGQKQVDTSEKPLTQQEAAEWKQAAADGLGFAGNVGAIAKKVKEMLEEARLKSKLMEPDEDRDKAFEEADKMFKELQEFMEDFKKDIADALQGMQVEGDEPLPDTAVSDGEDIGAAGTADTPSRVDIYA